MPSPCKARIAKHQNSLNDLYFDEEASKFNFPNAVISGAAFQSQRDCVLQPGVGSQRLPRDCPSESIDGVESVLKAELSSCRFCSCHAVQCLWRSGFRCGGRLSAFREFIITWAHHGLRSRRIVPQSSVLAEVGAARGGALGGKLKLELRRDSGGTGRGVSLPPQTGNAS